MMASSEEEVWKERIPCVLGIDEAGRGPVLGPMIYTAAYCPKESLKALNSLGADDSKQLTEEQRENLRVKIDNANFLRSRTIVLSAQELSEKMLRKVKYNLNLISHDTALQLVEEVMAEGINVEEVYVDTVGNPDSYAKKFRDRFAQLKKVVVAKKADATYRIVGAASIVAKTTRDRQLKNWEFVEEERSSSYGPSDPNMAVKFCGPLGSGYPSDPITKAWMKNNCDNIFGYPSFVRFSWGTSKTILEKHAVRVEWESDEEEEEDSQSGKGATPKTKDIMSFFSARPKSKAANRPSKQRKLSHAVTLPQSLRDMGLKRASTLI